MATEAKTGKERFGNNFESEVLFQSNSVFLIERLETNTRGKPIIYTMEVTEYGIARSGGRVRTQERHGTMQPVQKVQKRDRNLPEVLGMDSQTEASGACPDFEPDEQKVKEQEAWKKEVRKMTDEMVARAKNRQPEKMD